LLVSAYWGSLVGWSWEGSYYGVVVYYSGFGAFDSIGCHPCPWRWLVKIGSHIISYLHKYIFMYYIVINFTSLEFTTWIPHEKLAPRRGPRLTVAIGLSLRKPDRERVAATNQQVVQPHRRKSLNTHTPWFYRPIVDGFNASTVRAGILSRKDSWHYPLFPLMQIYLTQLRRGWWSWLMVVRWREDIVRTRELCMS